MNAAILHQVHAVELPPPDSNQAILKITFFLHTNDQFRYSFYPRGEDGIGSETPLLPVCVLLPNPPDGQALFAEIPEYQDAEAVPADAPASLDMLLSQALLLMLIFFAV